MINVVIIIILRYNPENWKNKSYLRNDISDDDIHQFEKVLKILELTQRIKLRFKH